MFAARLLPYTLKRLSRELGTDASFADGVLDDTIPNAFTE